MMRLEKNQSNITSREWCIRVDCPGTPPEQFNSQHIWNFFQGRVGTVVRVSETSEDGRKWIKVGFLTEDDFKKALCMSGYTIEGMNIQVSPLSDRSIHSFQKPRIKHPIKSTREPDTRRNLYVLNVPHDISAQAYRDLFTPHGTPTHTVLLKTQDSCSRRRGFVVMSSHQEAQDVINWLDGICIRGFQLRVTWANIDRSNGFMSGYDRTTFLGNNESPSSELPITAPDSFIGPKSNGIGMDTSTIVASNIPLSLFSGNEIDSLFKPFGLVKNIQLIPPNPPINHPLSTLAPASPCAQTAIVTYEKAGDAIAAKNVLHAQVYDGFALAVGFVSKLGQDDPRTHGLSAPPFLNAGFSASTSQTTLQYGFRDPQLLDPPLVFEQTFRGLPASYDVIHAPHLTEFTQNSSYNNWTPYPPYIPQTLTRQLHQAFNLPSRRETDILTHPLHQHPLGITQFAQCAQQVPMQWP